MSTNAIFTPDVEHVAREAARNARLRALEEAARIADAESTRNESNPAASCASHIADAIRLLMEMP